MAWSDPVAAYCERLAPGFTGEPLNAVSNLAFLAAGIAVLRMQSRLQGRGAILPFDIAALPYLVLAVAACSFVFHTLATRWAAWLDVVSILAFCVFAIYGFMRHAVAAEGTSSLLAAALFAAVSVATRWLPPDTLNGSAAYFPNLLVLVGVTGYVRWRRALAYRSLALASMLFAAALALRTVDRAWCSALPVGTHFLWHLCTAAVIWLVSRELTLRRFSSQPMKAKA
jgi:Ceramidase